MRTMGSMGKSAGVRFLHRPQRIITTIVTALCVMVIMSNFVVFVIIPDDNLDSMRAGDDTKHESLVFLSAEEYKQLQLQSEMINLQDLHDFSHLRYVDVLDNNVSVVMEFNGGEDLTKKVDEIHRLLPSPRVKLPQGLAARGLDLDSILEFIPVRIERRKSRKVAPRQVAPRVVTFVYSSSSDSAEAFRVVAAQLKHVIYLHRTWHECENITSSALSGVVLELTRWWRTCTRSGASALLRRLPLLYQNSSANPLCFATVNCTNAARFINLCKKRHLAVDMTYLDDVFISAMSGSPDTTKVLIYLDNYLSVRINQALTNETPRDSFKSISREVSEEISRNLNEKYSNTFSHVLDKTVLAQVQDTYPTNRMYGLFNAGDILHGSQFKRSTARLEVLNFLDVSDQ